MTSVLNINNFSGLYNTSTPLNQYTPEEFKKCLANPNYIFPPNPVVNGDLDLSDNPGLTSLPRGLRVEGNLDLSDCTGLTSLPSDLHVEGNLNLCGCTGLTFLPPGLRVERDLSLDDCTALTSLPSDLLVGRNLSLDRCIALTSLPAILSMRGSLSLDGCIALTSLPAILHTGGRVFISDCIALTSLPADWHVGGDLYIFDCTGFTYLPSDLDVKGDLHINGCPLLTSLPSWITRLGWTSRGEIRDVCLQGTGLSQDIITRLMQTPAPGMRFYFSHAASVATTAFKSLQEALEFWKKETGNTTLLLPGVAFEPHELPHVLNFLGRLTTTAEYQNVQSRPILANRVMDAFKLMAENTDIKSRSYDLIYNGLASCDDRIISALDEIEIMVDIYNLEKTKMDETKLREIGKSYLLLEMVNKKADEHQKTLTWVDEIEIHLAFQTTLAERFKLRLSTRNMIFRGCAQIKTDEIHEIGDVIEKECTQDAVEKFLSTWSPWITYQRRNVVPSYESLKSIPATKKEYECCIGLEPTTQPVMYAERVYDYDAFVECFTLSGKDPFTNQPIDLSKLVRIALPSSPKEGKEEVDE